MDRTRLLQHFETLADMPGAIERIRILVLNFAVRGQLASAVSPSDESPEWRTFCAAVDRRAKTDGSANKPFEIPKRWRWAALGEVAEPCGQMKPDARFTYIDVGTIDNARGVIREVPEILHPEDAPSRARKLVKVRSVIYGTVRPYLRNIAVIDRQFSPPPIVSTAFAVLHPKPFLDSRFLFHWLRSEPFQDEVSAKMKGVAYPAISDSEFWLCPIPVPPPSEQKRIVAKVDELLALCDELEARQTAARECRSRLVRSAFDHLTSAPTPADFRRHATFVLKEFPHLTATSDAIPALRQSILTLAFQGKLIPQEPKDEPIEKLLQRIAKEREIYAEQSRFRTPIEDRVKGTPFSVPVNWKWMRLGSLCAAVTDGDHLPPPKSDKGVAFLTIGNITTGKIVFADCRFVPVSYFEALAPFRRPSPRDILYTVVGATYGRPALVDSDRPFCVQRHIAILKPAPSIDARFLEAVLQSPLAYDQASASTTGTAQPTIPLAALRNFLVPLPPFAEQRRIVARVEELMRWCDQLEAQLTAGQTAATHLLDALAARLLAA